MKIRETDLQLTKRAYFNLFNELHSAGMGLKKSFDKIDDLCCQVGYHNYYSSFESFKTAYYSREK
jgi:hypothetical protein